MFNKTFNLISLTELISVSETNFIFGKKIVLIKFQKSYELDHVSLTFKNRLEFNKN